MDEFIKQVAQSIGAGEDQVGTATGGLLDLIREKVGGDFGDLASKIPGAEQLADKAASGGGGGSDNMLGGLMKSAADMLGGKAGTALDLGSLLSDSGLDLEQGKGLVSKLIDLVRDKAGDDFLEGILGKVPELKSLLG